MASKGGQPKSHDDKLAITFASAARPMRTGESPRDYIIDIHRRLRSAQYPTANVWDIPGAEGLNPYRYGNHLATFARSALQDQERYLRVLDDMMSQPPWGDVRQPTAELWQMAGGNSFETARAAAFIAGVQPFRTNGIGMPMNLLVHAGKIADALGRYREQVDKNYSADKARRDTVNAGKPAFQAKIQAALHEAQEQVKNNPILQADDAAREAIDAMKRSMEEAWNDVGDVFDGVVDTLKWVGFGVAGVAALVVASIAWRNFRGR